MTRVREPSEIVAWELCPMCGADADSASRTRSHKGRGLPRCAGVSAEQEAILSTFTLNHWRMLRLKWQRRRLEAQLAEAQQAVARLSSYLTADASTYEALRSLGSGDPRRRGRGAAPDHALQRPRRYDGVASLDAVRGHGVNARAAHLDFEGPTPDAAASAAA